MRAFHMCNIATKGRSTGHNPFEVCLGYQPLAPIDVSIPVMQSNQVPCLDKEKEKAMKFTKKFIICSNRFINFWSRPLRNINRGKTNIELLIIFRLGIRYGHIYRRTFYKALIESFILFIMVPIRSSRKLVKMYLNSTCLHFWVLI